MRAIALRRVEREAVWRRFADGHARIGTYKVLGEMAQAAVSVLFKFGGKNRNGALAVIEGRGNRIAQPLHVVVRRLQLVYHQLYEVGLVSVHRGYRGKFLYLSVYAHLVEAAAAHIVKQLLVMALSADDQRRKQIAAAAGVILQKQRNDLLVGVSYHRLAGGRGVGCGSPGVQEPEKIVYLGDRAHGRARIVARGLLLYGNYGAQARDALHLRLLHDAHEVLGICGKGVHVAALALGIQSVKGKRRLSAAAETGDNHKPAPWNAQRDILEVVRIRTGDGYLVLALCHGLYIS